MDVILSVRNLSKVYAGGFTALRNVSLQIQAGEIFALLGQNGAGKTTLINTICGIVTPSEGEIRVGGFDVIRDFRKTRSLIGLVPQELSTDAFETVWDTVSFSRSLFGKSRNSPYIEQTLRQLSLWDKKNSRIRTLSGGMKRRVMIAKALSHEPKVLFLDEPSAGVDVSLRKDMWEQVRQLQKTGVTIILTTHYLEEAEEMAERVGVIDKGKIIVTENTSELMKQMGRKHLILELKHPLSELPAALSRWNLALNAEKNQLTCIYDPGKADNGVQELLSSLSAAGISYKDLFTKQSSLEEIFIQLVTPS